jgi:hypothetical protein
MAVAGRLLACSRADEAMGISWKGNTDCSIHAAGLFTSPEIAKVSRLTKKLSHTNKFRSTNESRKDSREAFDAPTNHSLFVFEY